jgi:asparagine synthase (glutamine-hydrolysing)
VAAVSGLEHHTLRIGPDFFSKFGSYADRTVRITDGCFGVTGSHEIYLHEQARRLSSIRVTGNFGSEVLRSMSTFKPSRLSSELFHSEFKPLLDAAQKSSVGGEHPVTFAAFKEIPWNLFGSLAAGRSQVTFRTPYLDNEIVALAFQAPQNLRQSPLPALRVVKNNSPILSKIPTDRGLAADAGNVLRRVYSEVTFKLDYLYNEGLPHWLSPLDPVLERFNSGNILGLHKYLPYRRWFRRELATYIKERLTDTRMLQMPYWNTDFIENLAEKHIDGHKNYVREINVVLTLEAVHRLIMKGPAQVDVQGDGRQAASRTH